MAETFNLNRIDRIRYRPTKAAEEFLGDLRTSLNLGDKATAAKLAIARSLLEKSSVSELAIADGVDRGLAIEGVHLFGDDADLWSCVICSSSGKKISTESEFRQLVEGHWHRGAKLLRSDHEEAGKSDTDFVVRLAGMLPVRTPMNGPRVGGSGSTGRAITHLIETHILTEGEAWSVNSPGGNGLMVVSGRPGSGKSQLVLDLLAQISNQGAKFLFFDLKGELEDTADNLQQRAKRDQFFKLTNARYIRLIQEGLPINPLIRGGNSAENAQIASEMASLVRAFASQLGAVQERVLREAYESLVRPDFDGLVNALRDRGEEGVALSIVDKIASFNLFAGNQSAVSIAEWLSESTVIDFKQLGNDNETKSLAVAFILNAIMRQLNKNLPIENGVQPLQMVLFVDEAHLLLPKEGKAGLLGSLARQGRSWGFPVWLASQDADAFLTRGDNATNFAELADCAIHLSPQTLSESEQRKIVGQVIHKKLVPGEGVLKLRGVVTTGKIRQFWRDGGRHGG
jgi:DNA sulfur modification protein DndE